MKEYVENMKEHLKNTKKFRPLPLYRLWDLAKFRALPLYKRWDLKHSTRKLMKET